MEDVSEEEVVEGHVKRVEEYRFTFYLFHQILSLFTDTLEIRISHDTPLMISVYCMDRSVLEDCVNKVLFKDCLSSQPKNIV